MFIRRRSWSYELLSVMTTIFISGLTSPAFAAAAVENSVPLRPPAMAGERFRAEASKESKHIGTPQAGASIQYPQGGADLSQSVCADGASGYSSRSSDPVADISHGVFRRWCLRPCRTVAGRSPRRERGASRQPAIAGHNLCSRCNNLPQLRTVTATTVCKADVETTKWSGNGIILEVSERPVGGIVSIRRAADAPALFLAPHRVETTWELIMVSPDDKQFTVDPVSGQLAARVERHDDRLRMVWQPAEIPSGSVKVVCRFTTWPPETSLDGDPLIYGRISVKNRSDCDLRAVQFPRFTLVPNHAPGEATTLVFPRAYGL